MKTIKYLVLFLVLFLLPLTIKGESCDLNKITIESFTIENSNGNAVEKSTAAINNKNINIDLGMSNVGDNITYKMVVKNDSEDDFVLDNTSFDKTSEYIEYTFDDEKSVTIKSKSTETINLKIEYKNEVPATLLSGNTYEDTNNITLSLSTLTNPKTGITNLSLIFMFILLISVLFYSMFTKKKFSKTFIVLAMILFPISIYGVCKCDITINSKVEIKKIAEFDTGNIVNIKLMALAQNADNIKSFKRSSTLPDDIKLLAESQLLADDNANITVSDDEVNALFDIVVARTNDISYFKTTEKNGQKLYNYSFDNAYYYYEKQHLIDIIKLYGLIVASEKYEEPYHYLTYNESSNEIEEVTKEEYKNKIKEKLLFEKKVKLKKNILSSSESDYLIYGWYDESDNSIKYYCEKEEVYLNSDSSHMFERLLYVSTLPGLEQVNTSNVKNMSFMFYGTGGGANTLELNLTDFDTSNVTDMFGMFASVGYSATTWSIGNLNNWDTSKVTNMGYMFARAGYKATAKNIGNLSNWNTSNVTNMSGLFSYMGYFDTNFELDLSRWDTSKVTHMSEMFSTFVGKTGDLSNWNTSAVVNINNMFDTANLINIGNINNWDTSKVINMSRTFAWSEIGETGELYELDLSHWNVSNVINMRGLFSFSGQSATAWHVTGLNNWNTSNVVDMNSMFNSAGANATTWIAEDLSNWNTSKVENMSSMFRSAGYRATTWSLGDLSNWNTSNVTETIYTFGGAGTKATTWSVGDLSNWNTSKITNMFGMFSEAGAAATTWNVGNLGNWDTSNVTNMRSMFEAAGANATTWYLGDLSNWDTSKVENMRFMFAATGKNATIWSIGDLSNWDTSKVTDMLWMFKEAGVNATTWNNIGTFKTYADNISGIFYYCKKANLTLNIYTNSSDYSSAFGNASQASDASIVVNYTSDVTDIDKIIATKWGGSHVTKGELIQ